MPSTAKNRAYQRGLKAAGVWLHFKKHVKTLGCLVYCIGNTFSFTYLDRAYTCSWALCFVRYRNPFCWIYYCRGVLFLWTFILLNPQKGVISGKALDDSNYWWWWKSK